MERAGPRELQGRRVLDAERPRALAVHVEAGALPVCGEARLAGAAVASDGWGDGAGAAGLGARAGALGGPAGDEADCA